MDILARILSTKRREIIQSQTKLSLNQAKQYAQQIDKPRDFTKALLDNIQQQKTAIIAEIKKASPSKGVIRENFELVQLVKSYEAGGASCLSILTDNRYFQGRGEYLSQAKSTTNLPLLQKDFIIDEYQVYQASILGADCILLIVAAFEDDCLMKNLSEIAQSLGLSVLVEVHNQPELERALKLNLALIGINNRNLKTFKTSLETTIDLLSLVPKGVAVISESGIFSHNDISKMQAQGVYGFLVGEALMRERDVQSALVQLING